MLAIFQVVTISSELFFSVVNIWIGDLILKLSPHSCVKITHIGGLECEHNTLSLLLLLFCCGFCNHLLSTYCSLLLRLLEKSIPSFDRYPIQWCEERRAQWYLHFLSRTNLKCDFVQVRWCGNREGYPLFGSIKTKRHLLHILCMWKRHSCMIDSICLPSSVVTVFIKLMLYCYYYLLLLL